MEFSLVFSLLLLLLLSAMRQSATACPTVPALEDDGYRAVGENNKWHGRRKYRPKLAPAPLFQLRSGTDTLL
jgi:hypothetical protein